MALLREHVLDVRHDRVRKSVVGTDVVSTLLAGDENRDALTVVERDVELAPIVQAAVGSGGHGDLLVCRDHAEPWGKIEGGSTESFGRYYPASKLWRWILVAGSSGVVRQGA
jgi:hypothetical protein